MNNCDRECDLKWIVSTRMEEYNERVDGGKIERSSGCDQLGAELFNDQALLPKQAATDLDKERR